MSENSIDGDHHFVERRKPTHLSDEQVEAIAEKAAEKAVEKMKHEFFQSVGQTVVQKFLWIVGAAAVGAWMWAKQHGLIE